MPNEFFFGTLNTIDKRVAYSRQRQRGVRHDNRLLPQAPRPGDPPTVVVSTELPHAVERVVCTLQEPQQQTVVLQPAGDDWDLLNWRYFQTWQARLPAYAAGTTVRYTIAAYPAGGGDPLPADEGQTFSYTVGQPGPPQWAHEAIIYQIFPDRFHPGAGHSWREAQSMSDIHGGTLQGIVENLDYVADLGFNCIWLNPFFPDETHHGYHATDYFDVEPRLGDMSVVRRLVEEAHARGIRVLLDFVANHWSSEHPTFRQARADRNSDYYHWYRWREWPDDYETFFGVRELPQINVDHPAAREHLLRAADFWLSDVGFDGYRLDYAHGPSHDFWRAFHDTVKSARPDAWIFGEVVETPPVQLSYDGRLDGTLDFLLMQALRDTFAFRSNGVAQFDAFLNAHERFFPPHFSRPSFLDNHDINRFLWLVGGDRQKLKLAALCQFTLIGPPIVYYGAEVGVTQERDIVQGERHVLEEARQPMRWGGAQDDVLHLFYHDLIHLRRAHPALWRGDRRTVYLDDEAGLYAYTRSDEHETVLVALNLGDHPHRFEAAGHSFDLPPWAGDVQIFAADVRAGARGRR